MTTRIQLRRDSVADWTSNNPTLSVGEIGYETDTGYIKIGDGSTAWDSLGYPTISLDGLVMTGNVVMPNGGTIGQAAGPLLTFDDTNNYLEITGCSVGIGTDTPLASVHTANTTGLSQRMDRYTNGTGPAVMNFRKTRSTTIGTFGTIVEDGDGLGQIVFYGDDGVDVESAAADILVEVDGTPGSNTMPGRILFRTSVASTLIERMRISSDGLVGINETENTFMTQGLTINQGANDDEILAFKSSEIGHGVTSVADTTTFASFSKAGGETGGLCIIGLTEGIVGTLITSIVTTETVTDTVGSNSACILRSYAKDSTGTKNLGDTGNVMSVENGSLTRFIIKGNGDIHATNTTITALDDEDDIALSLATKDMMTRDKVGITEAMKKKLHEVGIFNEAGDMINIQRMQALQFGTVGQLVNILKGFARYFNIPEDEVMGWAKQYA